MEDRLREYEMVLVLDPSLEETGIQEEIGKCREIIESQGGTLGSVTLWGRKKLAYAIKKRTDGFYVLMELQAKPGIARELDQELRVREVVLRYLTVLAPAKSVAATGKSSDAQDADDGESDETGSTDEDNDSAEE